MSLTMIIFLLALMLIVFWQLAKASEHIAALKKREDLDPKFNRTQAWSWVAFGILFFVAIYYNHVYFGDKMLPEPSSEHGVEYERMFNITLFFTGVVFVITHILLFYFIYKYRSRPGQKASFIAHNNKLEIIWTAIPALVMFVLVIFGLRQWFFMTGPAPDNAMKVEVWGKQFNWMFRYAGADNKFGTRDWRLTNDADNPLGQLWDDRANLDDIQTNELHLVKGVPVELIIGSRDVLHDVGLPHFRMKADAVPGVMTRMWFTPTKSTNDMIKETANKDFVYEISCDQMCGRSHYSMRGVVIVHDTQEDYDKWMSEQQPYYSSVGPGAPAADGAEETETTSPEAAPEDAPATEKEEVAEPTTARAGGNSTTTIIK